MKNAKVGDKFGRLTIVALAGSGKIGTLWECACDCGNKTVIKAKNFGHTQSCGCAKSRPLEGVPLRVYKKNGIALPAEYTLWSGMKNRCSNPKAANWHFYGGRGIKVCDRWLVFENFFSDMGPRPDGMSLDRIDNNGNYEPRNCRWATPKQQLANSRRSIFLTFNGETLNLSDWAARVGVGPNTMSRRISAGWTLERALTAPPFSK